MPDRSEDPHERKRAPEESAESRAPGAGSEGDEKDPERSSAGSGDSSRGRGTVHQLGTILTKGLDLAEASLSLGLKVIHRAGAAAVRAAAEADPMADGHEPPPADRHPDTDHGVPPEPPPPAPSSPPQSEHYHVTNRLPLIPGGDFRVSFSINNDSMEAAKKVTLRIEEFTGETSGARIAAGDIAVKPMRKTIAPMDFDKFVLQGTVPADLPPDAYRGRIVVSSGNEFPIPVRLVVMGD